jgi:hypothetical protein
MIVAEVTPLNFCSKGVKKNKQLFLQNLLQLLNSMVKKDAQHSTRLFGDESKLTRRRLYMCRFSLPPRVYSSLESADSRMVNDTILTDRNVHFRVRDVANVEVVGISTNAAQ